MVRHVPKLIVIVLTLLAAGCGSSGPEVASVTGQVTLDGKPLENATVTFQPLDGRPSFGTTDKEGHYEMNFTLGKAGVMLGKNSVFIRTRMESESGQVIQKEFLPARYHDRSELTAEVENKANVRNFELNSK